MIRKTALAFAALLAISFTGTTTPARADTDINIYLGYGGFYGRNISCRRGAHIVDRRFNRVAAVDCHGKTYRYVGWRKGKRYMIYLSAYSGRITQIHRY